MALDWDVSKIKDFEALCYVKAEVPTDVIRVAPITDALIWSTINLGMRGISKSTAAEFYARLRLSQLLFGPLIYDGMGDPYMITAADVVAHIGLDTNVTPRTRAQFLAQVRDEMDRWKREAERELLAIDA